MDANQINTILLSAGGVLTALGGFEFIKWLFTRRSNEKIAEANAFKVQRDALMEDYSRLQHEVDVLNKKVNDLYEKLHRLENERLDLIRENNELKLALKEAEKHVCLQPDDKCLRRLPQTVKCRFRTLLSGGYEEDHPDAIITEEDMLKPMKADEDNRVPEDADKG